MSNKQRQKAKPFVTFRAPPSLTDDAINKYLSSLASPRALTVWLLYSYKEHDQLTQLSCDPLQYDCVTRFREDYAATKFLSKASFLKTSFNKKKVALEKFQKFEDQCRSTNAVFRNLSSSPFYLGMNASLLNAMTRKVAQVLGDFAGDEVFDSGNWGKGVTTQLKGSYVSSINKFHLENGITRDLYSLVGPVFERAYPLWHEHLVNHQCIDERSGAFAFEIGNSLSTVPKDSKADRVIAVEPGINLWFQKAAGTMIRKRLRRFSIDLNDQTKNANLSKVASLNGRNATIDFSSASDSISLELVREVLPPRWFLLLDSCRSKYGTSANGTHWWEKFSSMGNGFTFELESLLFFAAAHAVCEVSGSPVSAISVYGDDVIIPADCVQLYTSFCAFLGFTVNSSKSFSTGYFRESCGSHFWGGIDVKPIFLKERLTYVQDVYKLANSIRLLSHRRNSYGCDRAMLPAWRCLVAGIPKPLRLRISATLGEVGLISNFDEATPSKVPDGIEGYYCLALVPVSVTDCIDSPAVLMARLWTPSVLENGNTYSLRGRTEMRIKSLLVHQWYNLGPWV